MWGVASGDSCSKIASKSGLADVPALLALNPVIVFLLDVLPFFLSLSLLFSNHILIAAKTPGAVLSRTRSSVKSCLEDTLNPNILRGAGPHLGEVTSIDICCRPLKKTLARCA